jgi:hypothetical protein
LTPHRSGRSDDLGHERRELRMPDSTTTTDQHFDVW